MARNRNSAQSSPPLDTDSKVIQSRAALAANTDSDRTRTLGAILDAAMQALPSGDPVPDHFNLLISGKICHEELRNAGGASAEVKAQLLGALGIRTVWP